MYMPYHFYFRLPTSTPFKRAAVSTRGAYFSVEHTVSPKSVVSNTSSGCSVEYTILNLMRCRSYHSTATALLGNQRGNSVVMGDPVMLSELLQLICTNLMMEGLASITLHSHNNFKSVMEQMALSFHISVSTICSVHSNGGHFLRSRSIHHHQCHCWSRS